MFRGVFPIVPTPFDQSGEIDTDSFRRVVRYAVAAGAEGAVFPANASEFATLSVPERKTLAEALTSAVAGRVKVIVGVTSDSPDEAAALAQHAQSIGADGLLLLLPEAFRDSYDSLLAYVRCVADSCQLPVIMQNAPAPPGASLSVERVTEIAAAVPTVQYVKEEISPTGQRIAQLKQRAGASIQGVFGGDGGRSILNELPRGALGTMPAIELTEMFADLVRLYNGGAREQATDLFCQMLPLLNVQRVFKWAMTKRILVWRGIIDYDHVRVSGAPALDAGDEAELRMWYEKIRHHLRD